MKGTKIERCPRCGKSGLLTEKPTVSKGHRYIKTYVAHYIESGVSTHGKRLSRVKWCYLNREQIDAVCVKQTKKLCKAKRQESDCSAKNKPKWSLGRDSNPRPTAYKAIALTS